ncbi:MAG: Ethanolamine utilization protein EutN/carboxysome structural protein Ccml [Firmicutes bacterium]|nr:Ethanolamine utilization protein EutN/carboxysome structural protein Ccml [Bacillota bacterium]
MWVGKVVGNVVATRKDDSLVGSKLLIVMPLHGKNQRISGKELLVAVDTIGAGKSETVLVITGSSARNIVGQGQGAIDAAIVGIVDTVEVDERLLNDRTDEE